MKFQVAKMTSENNVMTSILIISIRRHNVIYTIKDTIAFFSDIAITLLIC